MTNDKLAQHISNKLWVQKSKVVEVLGKFEETPQRDYTGVRFKHNFCGVVKVIEKEKETFFEKRLYSINGVIRVYYTQEEVERLFANGTWVELTQEETPPIHAQKPSDFTLEERVKALELIVNEMRKDKECQLVEAPTLKRNLPIETEDWKKVECLSWEDVKEILSSGLSIDNYIKNKLKK